MAIGISIWTSDSKYTLLSWLANSNRWLLWYCIKKTDNREGFDLTPGYKSIKQLMDLHNLISLIEKLLVLNEQGLTMTTYCPFSLPKIKICQ